MSKSTTTYNYPYMKKRFYTIPLFEHKRYYGVQGDRSIFFNIEHNSSEEQWH